VQPFTAAEEERLVLANCPSSGEAELVQDTSWQGYEQIPQWIVDGYSTAVHTVAVSAHIVGTL